MRQCLCSRRWRKAGELLLKILVETTDGAGTLKLLPSGFGRLLPRMSRAYPSHKHLDQSLGHLRGVSSVAVEDLGVELALAISGDLQPLDPTRGCDQVGRGCRSRCDTLCCCRLLSPQTTPRRASSSTLITPSNTTRMPALSSSRRYC